MEVEEARQHAAATATQTFLVRGFAYAALMLTVWDWITTLRFELLVIWRKSTDRRVKTFFIVSRYLGLASQAINAFIAAFIQFDVLPTVPYCRAWYGSQLAVTQILLLSLEMILLFRLQALYLGLGCRWHWFHTALLIQTIIITATGSHAIHHLRYHEGVGCIPMNSPSSVVYLAAAQITSHVVIWSMTLYKYFSIYYRNGWKAVPILSLVTRDGFWVFLSVTGMLTAVILEGAHRGITSRGGSLVSIIFPLYVALVTISSCRIIMNIRVFASEVAINQSMDTRTGNIELTSLFGEDRIDSDSEEVH